MTTLKFLWIDDDLDRKRNARGIEAYQYKAGASIFKADVEFLPLKQKDPIKLVEEFTRFPEFDLILIDQVLTYTTGIVRKGTTLAEVIREKAPMRPIVGVTAEGNRKEISPNVRSIFEDLFIISELNSNHSSLFTIALTFREYSKKVLKNTVAKAKLFAPPEDDIELLKQILPATSPNLAFDRTFYHWALHELIAKPGLLYNRLWAANIAGVKETSFHKIESLFDDAIYTGIFCNSEKPLWWKSKLKELIFQNTTNKNTSLPWEAGHYLSGVTKKDYSICSYCKKDKPETLGYLDPGEKSSLVPLHFDHSEPHPAFTKALYFDEIRLMKDSKK